MTTTLNNSYLVKLSTLGEGGQNCPKFCLRGLYTPLYLLEKMNRDIFIREYSLACKYPKAIIMSFATIYRKYDVKLVKIRFSRPTDLVAVC